MTVVPARSAATAPTFSAVWIEMCAPLTSTVPGFVPGGSSPADTALRIRSQIAFSTSSPSRRGFNSRFGSGFTLGDVLKTCRTLVWNGPLGAFETPPFDAATVALARTAAALTKEGGLISVAGGGDTVAALNHAGVAGDFTYVSTAGGAFLEWMEGRELPGVAALAR